MIKNLTILTVALIMAISVNAQKTNTWQTVGSTFTVSTGSEEYLPQLFADVNGDMYMAYSNSGEGVAVKKLNGNTWEQVGDSEYISDDLYCKNIRITGYAGELYFSYVTDAGAKVYRLEGTSWFQLGNTFPATAGSLEIYHDGSNLSVLYNDQGMGELRVDRWSNTNGTWEQLFGIIESGIFMNPRAFFTTGDYVYVAYENDGNINIKSTETGAWANYATYDGVSDFKMKNRYTRPNIAFLNGTDVEMYELDVPDWEQIGTGFDVGGQNSYQFAISESGDRTLIYVANNNVYAKTIYSGGSDWEDLGASPFLEEYVIIGNVVYGNGGIPYFVFFHNANSHVEVMKYDVAADINNISENNIEVYPNPTNGIVNFDFANNNIQKIVISDITGKQIIEKVNIQQNEMIDISSFESGIYIIKIQTDNEIFTTKIVKE